MTEPREEAQALAKVELNLVQEELTELEDWVLRDEEDNDFAGKMLVELKLRYKALEAKRKSIVDPMNKALREVNGLFKKPKDELLRAEELLKRKVAEYFALAEEQNDQAYEIAARAESPQEATEAMSQIKDVATPKNTSIRYKYKAVVVDPDQVPGQFLSPDLNKIKAFMDASIKERGQPTPVEGIRFEKTPIVSVRTKR